MLGLVTAEVAASLDPDLVPLHEALVARVGAERIGFASSDDGSVVTASPARWPTTSLCSTAEVAHDLGADRPLASLSVTGAFRAGAVS